MPVAGVPLLDLKAQFDSIADEIMPVVERVCRSQQFILGSEVEGLERELADYCQVGHALGVSSGSDALLMAMMALDIGPGDEVLCPSYTFFATGGAVARMGATPVFVDIEPVSYNLDPADLERKVGPRAKAIIPVHLFGRCAEMDAIHAIAERHGLAVIEDACQAIGAEFKGRRAGGLGRIACFSFFPSKNLGGFGDGGAVTTDDKALYEKMKCLRVHGEKTRYYHELVGANFRLDALQAAVLRVKLRHLDAWTEGRRRNAELYDRLFAERGLAGTRIKTPVAGENRHIFNQYVIRAEKRDGLREALSARSVGTQIYYPVPLHLQECFAYLGQPAGSLPASERAAAESLALPIYPELTRAQIEYVVEAIADAYRELAEPARRRRAA